MRVSFFPLVKKFWEERITYFPLVRHGPHRKRRIQQFLSCCACIRCRGKVFNPAFASNDKGTHVQTHRLIGGICEVRRWNGLRCHDNLIRTKFHKNWFRHSKFNSGNTQLAWWLHKPTFIFENRESRLKNRFYENDKSWLKRLNWCEIHLSAELALPVSSALQESVGGISCYRFMQHHITLIL
jgi:hypothetical protein